MVAVTVPSEFAVTVPLLPSEFGSQSVMKCIFIPICTTRAVNVSLGKTHLSNFKLMFREARCSCVPHTHPQRPRVCRTCAECAACVPHRHRCACRLIRVNRVPNVTQPKGTGARAAAHTAPRGPARLPCACADGGCSLSQRMARGRIAGRRAGRADGVAELSGGPPLTSRRRDGCRQPAVAVMAGCRGASQPSRRLSRCRGSLQETPRAPVVAGPSLCRRRCIRCERAPKRAPLQALEEAL